MIRAILGLLLLVVGFCIFKKNNANGMRIQFIGLLIIISLFIL